MHQASSSPTELEFSAFGSNGKTQSTVPTNFSRTRSLREGGNCPIKLHASDFGGFSGLGSFTFLGNKRVKILNSSLENPPKELSPGEIYTSDEDRLYVGCLDHKFLRIHRLQIESKQPVEAKDFIKGNKEKIVQVKKFSSSLEK